MKKEEQRSFPFSPSNPSPRAQWDPLFPRLRLVMNEDFFFERQFQLFVESVLE